MEKTIYSEEYSMFLRLLRETREASEISQTDIAMSLGKTQSFVSKVERGERRLDIVELRAFCQAMGISFLSFASRFEESLNGNQPVPKIS